MDKPMFGMKYFTPLEKIVHAFHMEEMWEMIHHEYVNLKSNPPTKDAFECAMDVERNGVLEMFRFLAFREPEAALRLKKKQGNDPRKKESSAHEHR
ncbi:unnamed protein product, partial [Mesorhabditis belari]|uniref:Uncharacterized protein n=1 Tax=Mesorhabditis belari TaxID=2138241 RepID=A0AAF3EKC8_9BILA